MDYAHLRFCYLTAVGPSVRGVAGSPLFKAASEGNIAVVKELLAKGAAPNQGSFFQ